MPKIWVSFLPNGARQSPNFLVDGIARLTLELPGLQSLERRKSNSFMTELIKGYSLLCLFFAYK
jgi:hypothetical protein